MRGGQECGVCHTGTLVALASQRPWATCDNCRCSTTMPTYRCSRCGRSMPGLDPCDYPDGGVMCPACES